MPKEPNLPEPQLDQALIASLSSKIREGKVSLVDVLKVIVPDVRETELSTYVTPLPATITPKAKAALEELPNVFGSVVPFERRKLSGEELTGLLAERDVCDTILKLVKDRKDSGIRTTILNHIDVWMEENYTPEQLAETERDSDGHYYYPQRVEVQDTGKDFSWEITDGTPTLSPEKLKELDERGEIDHALYLEITDPVRVVNEQKLLLAMSKKPFEVLKVVKEASVPAKKKGSLYVRNSS